MTIGVDMRMSLDEAHALKWGLEYLFTITESDVIRVPAAIKADLHSALVKAMQGNCNAIEWVEQHEKPTARSNQGNQAIHAAADPAAAVAGDVADVPQPQTLEVPFRE